MNLREAAQQALEAYDKHEPLAVVMEDLRTALAEPEHEPHCALLQIPSRDCNCGADPLQPLADAELSLGLDYMNQDSWTDADADAARLAMELEALLLSTKDTAAVSRWWDSAHEALDLHRQRLRQP